MPFTEYLDLEGYLAPRKRDFLNADGKGGGEGKRGGAMYRLVSVVVHIGNMASPTLVLS